MPAGNDGAVPFGSISITINSVAYIAENITPTKSDIVIQRRGATNLPTGAAFVAEFQTGSATLQLATSSTALPGTFGESDVNKFTADLFSIGSGTHQWAITRVGRTYAQADHFKVDIDFQKLVN